MDLSNINISNDNDEILFTKISHDIIKYSIEKDTDISSHLPQIFNTCAKHLQKSQDPLVVEIGIHNGDFTYIIDQLAKIQPIHLIGVTMFTHSRHIYQTRAKYALHHFYEMDDSEYSKIHKIECSKLKIKSEIDIL